MMKLFGMSAMRVEPVLPTASDIRKLPRWAKVALAARCCRRVQPLLSVFLPALPTRQQNVLDLALQQAEHAATETPSKKDDHLIAALQNCATECESLARTILTQSAAAGWLALAVARTAQCAAEACKSNRAIIGQLCLEVLQALAECYPSDRLLQGLQRDYLRLQQLSGEEEWTKDTAVSPKRFTAMWPSGLPADWPG